MTLIAKPTAKHRPLRYLDTLDNKIHVEIHRRISYYLHDEIYLGHFGLRIDEQNRLTLLNAQDASSAHFAVRLFVLQSKSGYPSHVQPSSHLDIFVHSESNWHQLPN